MTLREQEALGIDIVTDGEQRREGFIFHMCRTWDGIDLVNQVQKESTAAATRRAWSRA